ncbi:MAG: hypothetical protein ACRED5_22995 [Propylenella sp.]
MSRFPALVLAAALAFSAAPLAQAEGLMERFAGEWAGEGLLLFGPQYGTEFECELKSEPSASETNFDMSGRCWIGILSASARAQLRYNPSTGEYYGEFLDGADGSGADMVGAASGTGISLKLMKGALQGKLTAEKVTADQMKVMLYYRDTQNSRDLPIVAMGFARKGSGALPDYLPSFVTGSITPRN